MCHTKSFGIGHDSTLSETVFSLHCNQHGDHLQLCIFLVRSFLVGLLGGASSLEAGMPNLVPNLDPFFTSSFDHNFRTNDNQTFIVYVKSALILFRKGLCVFSGFWICPRRKVMQSKCHKFFKPERVVFLTPSGP